MLALLPWLPGIHKYFQIFFENIKAQKTFWNQ